jgi:methylthioribulose-1-phosphate dehydratase
VKPTSGNHPRKLREQERFSRLARGLCEVGKIFYARGWALGTGGNYSSTVSVRPLRLAVTASGADKGALKDSEILEVDHLGQVVHAKLRPSYEVMLHLAIVQSRAAGAVLHTHSVWATILSETHASRGGLAIRGYEMLKGLAGVTTHDHNEWVPILQNSQDMAELAKAVQTVLGNHFPIHGFLLQGHGLYTWGRSLEEARRHVEIFEFLFEVVGRRQSVATDFKESLIKSPIPQILSSQP